MSDNLAYKEEPRQEIVNGEVVMMALAGSNHNRISRNLTRIFDTYLLDKQCEYFPDGEGLFLSEQEEYIPDGMVVCDPDKVNYKGVFGAPDLVIEILSRATAKNDRNHKKAVYGRYGVKEYWIIDPVKMTVEQYVLQGGELTLRATYAFPATQGQPQEFKCSLYDDLTIKLTDVFARVK